MADYKNKVLLVTGGSGSFGQTMVQYFLNTDIKEIRVFSRDEEKHDRMRNKYKDSRIKYYIGDVRDEKAIEEATLGVDLCFHAAALKEVPSCEFWPIEAVKTNIIGSNNVIDACIKNQVKRLVVLSTDKAVYPINAMGMTKAVMEKLMISKSRNIDPSKTVICATRYGNVMASRGSVIPLFVKQCKENKPITITDPKMTRFLMSLDESVELVLFAVDLIEIEQIFALFVVPASVVAEVELTYLVAEVEPVYWFAQAVVVLLVEQEYYSLYLFDLIELALPAHLV